MYPSKIKYFKQFTNSNTVSERNMICKHMAVMSLGLDARGTVTELADQLRYLYHQLLFVSLSYELSIHPLSEYESRCPSVL